MTTLDEDLDAALTAKASDPEWADVEVAIGGKYRTLRFTQMDGLAWADLAAQCPPNLKSKTDMAYGYSLRAMTILAAPASGALVVGDATEPITADQWSKFFRAATGRDHRSIANALFTLNEWLPSEAVAAARKEFEAESAKNSSSPANSESPTAGSSESGPDET